MPLDHEWHKLTFDDDDEEVSDAGFNAFIKQIRILEKRDFKLKIVDERDRSVVESGILNCGVNFNEYHQLVNPNRICLQYHGDSDKNEKIFKEYMQDVYFNTSSSKIGKYKDEKRGHVYCFDRPSTFIGVFGTTSTRGTEATDFFRNLMIKNEGR